MPDEALPAAVSRFSKYWA